MSAMPQRPEGQFRRKCREAWRGGGRESTTKARRTSADGCLEVDCDWPTVHRENRRKQMTGSVTRWVQSLNQDLKNLGCRMAKHLAVHWSPLRGDLYLISKYHARLSDLPSPGITRLIRTLLFKVRSWKTTV